MKSVQYLISEVRYLDPIVEWSLWIRWFYFSLTHLTKLSVKWKRPVFDFRSAKEAEMSEKRAKDRGEELPKEARFDSNCITPGTR